MAVEKVKTAYLTGTISLIGKGKSVYTDEEDRWILNMLTITDYGRWNKFAEYAKNDPRWKFNWFIKSRSPNDFHRRAEYVAKLVKKS